MTDFDTTTRQRAEEFAIPSRSTSFGVGTFEMRKIEYFEAGRTDVRESLSIALRALERAASGDLCFCGVRKARKIEGECYLCECRSALTAIRERGDYVEEKK